jgi:hypothetical protein
MQTTRSDVWFADIEDRTAQAHLDGIAARGNFQVNQVYPEHDTASGW